MKIQIKQGEAVTIVLEDADGEFVVEYGKNVLSVTADLPDTNGRVGEIYAERFGEEQAPDDEVELKERCPHCYEPVEALPDVNGRRLINFCSPLHLTLWQDVRSEAEIIRIFDRAGCPWCRSPLRSGYHEGGCPVRDLREGT